MANLGMDGVHLLYCIDETRWDMSMLHNVHCEFDSMSYLDLWKEYEKMFGYYPFIGDPPTTAPRPLIIKALKEKTPIIQADIWRHFQL